MRTGFEMSVGELLANPQTYVSFLTLTLLEVVLGIDNIVFISILAGRLPSERQRPARRIGLGVALVARLCLLLGISWVMTLERGLFTLPVLETEISGKDLILIVGGLFLLAKATHEIYENVERPAEHQPTSLERRGDFSGARQFASLLLQIALLDLVFSLDSVITAVGMIGPNGIPIMMAAIIAAVLVMILFSGPVGDFVTRHASIRVLALSFLVLIGFLLLAEGFDKHIPKGYVYFAMAFALGMELLNMRMKSRHQRLVKERAAG